MSEHCDFGRRDFLKQVAIVGATDLITKLYGPFAEAAEGVVAGCAPTRRSPTWRISTAT